MKEKMTAILNEKMNDWTAPVLPQDIPHGDMPGDKVNIGEGHIQKAGTIFPILLGMLKETVEKTGNPKVVVAVHGGSGVGKSEVASLLTYYLNDIGIGAYTMSGDNYPRRIPLYNDAERLREYRVGGLRGLLTNHEYSDDIAEQLIQLEEEEKEADPAMVETYPWLSTFQREGRSALTAYLGTMKEQDFDEVTNIIRQFKAGEKEIFLKRMGRTETALWYDAVDFSNIQVLIIEWTHGNNRLIQGVDIPILLNSTPQETREYRRLRGRDGKTDSAFTTMVLEIEQKLLDSQADRAKLIIAKDGSILTYHEYRQLMVNQA